MKHKHKFVLSLAVVIKIILLVFALVIVYELVDFCRFCIKASAENKYEKSIEWVTEKSGVDLCSGELVFDKDEHGFHGDGSSLSIYQYAEGTIEEYMEESHTWKKLPYTDNINNLLKNSIDDNCAECIPNIMEGYYFFYDRHEGRLNPYDDSDLWEEYSLDCTVTIYDTSTKKLYVYTKDT